MSPRRANPGTRRLIIDIAARLLAETGPQALTTRRIAAEAHCSTMAVYTYFSGMNGLVRAIVNEGFSRLQYYLTHVEQTDDPVADMALLGRAYRHNAITNSHLYAIMFGGTALTGFSLTEEDRQHGRYTLTNVLNCAKRCIAAQRFRSGNPGIVAHQMWTAVHGLVTLEIGDYLVEPCNAGRCFDAQLVGLMIGAGDALEPATDSVMASTKRFHREVEAIQQDVGG